MAKAKNLLGEEEAPVYSESRLSAEGKRILAELESLTVESLKLIHRAFGARAIGARALGGELGDQKMRKRDWCLASAGLLDFKSQREFDEFFSGLSPLARDAIMVGTFYRYVPTAPLEKKYKVEILIEHHQYGYGRTLTLNEGLLLGYFVPADAGALFLPELFRRIFSRYLPTPVERDPTPVAAPEGVIWSNVDFIREAAPLMGRLASEALKNQYHEEFARKGLSKTDCRKYRSEFGQEVFPIAGRLGLDSVDLYTRLAACLKPLADSRVTEGDEYLRRAVESFLNPHCDPTKNRTAAGAALEYLVLIDHLSRRQGYFMDAIYNLPPSRKVLKGLLLEIGKTRAWYAIKDLYQALVVRDEPFYFIDAYNERMGLLLRCSSLTVDGVQYSVPNYEEELPVAGRMREVILALPLLKAYCYVLALLGVVELAETEPVNTVTKRTKTIPLSPYDAASFVRVTDFGAWCLGLADEKPKPAERAFEAIADKELLLVTFRGKSIERRLYLEGIGVKLGEERYRVTEASFIRGCAGSADISRRVEAFKRLIDPTPSPRWLDFFASVKARIGLFSTVDRALLYPLPKDPTLAKAIISEPLLRPYIIRAEGGLIAVRTADERKFQKALREAGYFEKN